ncbi:MAG: hypothetical protein ACRDB0_05865 [Paraclostridium sp.]
MSRVKYTTTLDEETIKELDLLRIEIGLDARNDVIEYLTANYRGKKYVQYKTKKSKRNKCKENSK